MKEENQGLRFVPTKPTITVYDEAGKVAANPQRESINAPFWCDLRFSPVHAGVAVVPFEIGSTSSWKPATQAAQFLRWRQVRRQCVRFVRLARQVQRQQPPRGVPGVRHHEADLAPDLLDTGDHVQLGAVERR